MARILADLGSEGACRAEMAQRYGMTAESVRQIYRVALADIRKDRRKAGTQNMSAAI